MVGSHNWYWSGLLIHGRNGLTGSNPVPTANLEGTAEWSATGFENRSMVKHGRSIRLPSSKMDTL